MAAIIFPPSPAGQTPVNTFSPTSTPLANTSNSFTYTWNGTAWTSAPAGGGGSVTGTLPIVVTGSAISINAASTTAPGSVQLATAAEAAAGTDALKALTPATGVPKDAANMTGAAILPSGTNAQRTSIASPVAGMLRVNTDYLVDTVEAYDGVTASWRPLQYGVNLGTLPDLVISANGPLPSSGTYENITINAGVTAGVAGLCQLYARTSITINGTIDGFSAGLGSLNLGVAWGVAGQLVLGAAGGQGIGAPLGASFGGVRYGWKTLMGSAGSAGAVNLDALAASCSGRGGTSGGSVVFQCDGPIVVGPSAVINMKGGNGFSTIGTAGCIGGAGGGSGGLIVLESLSSLTVSAGATLNVGGGNGSPGVYISGLQSSYGGGGGGGGYIILSSPATTDASTKVLAGGTSGALTGLATPVNGGGGGGFGGAGAGESTIATPPSGSPGQLLLNQYL